MAGTVVSLQVCVKPRVPMRRLKSARALENLGLEGDRHAMPDSSRQVLLLEEETCIEFGFAPGDIRENITTRGLTLMTLPLGTRLAIGDAIFELTKECEPCAMVEDVQPGLRRALAHRRGMLARVVHGGAFIVGSPIRVLTS